MVVGSTFTDDLWTGQAKIVIAFDIGTTQAAASYSYLYPGARQVIHRVVKWPGQENHAGESKIPSVVMYNKLGVAQAFGAETRTLEVAARAEIESWHLVKHFKLSLHPKSIRANNPITIDPLPSFVSVEQIYSDFLAYLYQQTKVFFYNHILDGDTIWQNLESSIEFIITHPNGWGFVEQSVLRRAALSGGLVLAPPDALERIHFVTEAEASVHFMMLHTDFKDRLVPGDDFVLCDAGGSTVDTTLYMIEEAHPILRLKEQRASSCIQAGAIYVNQAAESFFNKKFQAGKFDAEDHAAYVADAVSFFEANVKKGFKGGIKEKKISIGNRKFNNKTLDIKKGSFTLKGTIIEGFFDPWTAQIVESIDQQTQGHVVKHLLLVGGFGESPYLREKLVEGLGSRGIKVTLTEESTSKAVADGAVIWFLKHAVVARATRYAFGCEVALPADRVGEEAMNRVVTLDSEGHFVAGGWRELVPRDKVLGDQEETTYAMYRSFATPDPDLSIFRLWIYGYDGPHHRPAFVQDPAGNLNPGFHKVCRVEADLSGLKGALKLEHGPRGPYWRVKYLVALTFGGTTLRASLLWEEHGQMQRSLATVVPHAFVFTSLMNSV